MHKKSQSALEFLTTYAWAFIIIIIMIATIAYFGILKPTKILPDRCNFPPGFDCQAYAMAYGTGAAGTFNIRLKNSLGQVITVTAINVSTENNPSVCAITSPALPSSSWAAGTITDFVFGTCNYAGAGFAKGDKAKLLVGISYYDAKAGATYAKVADGEVFATLT